MQGNGFGLVRLIQPAAFAGMAIITLFCGFRADAANMPPTQLAVREPVNAFEGQMFTVQGSFEDADAGDAHIVRVYWEGGVSTVTQLPPGVLTFEASHVYYYDSLLPIYPLIEVADEHGARASGSFAVTVFNVAPTIQSIVMSTNECNEGDELAIEVQFTDPGLYDYHRVEVSWGDWLDRFDVQGRFFARDHSFFDDTVFGDAAPITEISITLWDEFDYHTLRTNILVRNVAPTSPTLVLNTNAIAENSSVTLSGDFTDQGAFDQHSVAVDWGDGTPIVNIDSAFAHRFSASHTYADDPAAPSDRYNIIVTVADDDDGSSSSSASVIVTNVSPSLSNVQIAARVPARTMGVLRGTIEEECPTEMLSLEVNWGDGSEPQVVALPKGAADFAVSHVFRTGGPRCNVQVMVRDDDGGWAASRAAVEIVNGEGMPPCPPVLRMVKRRNDQVVEWDAPGVVLQTAPEMDGPWTDVIPLPTSPFTIPASEARIFFRTRP